ncbi:hypothetical protein D3C87_1874130 [compost metagenome]
MTQTRSLGPAARQTKPSMQAPTAGSQLASAGSSIGGSSLGSSGTTTGMGAATVRRIVSVFLALASAAGVWSRTVSGGFSPVSLSARLIVL